ncbi:unnamed protein product, partial [Rotaria sp. Silwood2]
NKLIAAAFYGHTDILEKLIQKGLDVNEFDKCSIKLVKLVCQYGDFDLNECTNSGETQLLMAIERNDYELVDYLLRQGAYPPDQPNNDKCYPIHLACFNGQENILYLLLSFNVTIEQSNENYPHPLVITTYKRDLYSFDL